MNKKEEVVVIVDFSMAKLIMKNGIVVKKVKLCDVGGMLNLKIARKINNEVGKALMEIK